MSNKRLLIIALVAVTATVLSCAQNNKKDIEDALGTICDTNSTGFATEIKPIFEQNCSTPSCHSAVTKAANYNLEDYQGIKDAVLGPRLFGTINHTTGFSPMPKGTTDKLSDCDINKITIWARNGAQNN